MQFKEPPSINELHCAPLEKTVKRNTLDATKGSNEYCFAIMKRKAFRNDNIGSQSQTYFVDKQIEAHQ